MMEKPNCYQCTYRDKLIGDAHSQCSNRRAKVKGNSHGINSGWFNHPYNFDSVWLVSCNGFK